MKLDPMVHPLFFQVLEQHHIPLPLAVADRVRDLMADTPLMMTCMLVGTEFNPEEFPGGLVRRWDAPTEELLTGTTLWREEDYPLCVREGRLDGKRVAEACWSEEGISQEGEFSGITCYRAGIIAAFADALLRFGYVFHVNPGEGAETMVVGLSGYRRPSDHDMIWLGASHAKTQYARQLERTHKNAVATMDILKEVGLLHSAVDDSGYYEHRDWDAARRRIGAELAFAGLVAPMFSGLVKQAAGTDGEVTVIQDHAGTAFDRVQDMGMSPGEAVEALGELVREHEAPATEGGGADAGQR